MLILISIFTSNVNVTKETIVAIIAPEKYPAPQAKPIPPQSHIVAAVVRPLTSVGAKIVQFPWYNYDEYNKLD